MKGFIAAWIFFAMPGLGGILAAQNPDLIYMRTDSLQNRLHVLVVDVVTRTEITGFKLTVYVGYDTIEQEVQAAKDFNLVLYQGMPYRLMITKPGYDTLRTEWQQPADTAEVYIDFYMRKPGITKKEKKEAIRRSRHPITRVTGDEAGFESVGGTKRYACEWTVYIYETNGRSSSIHNYRKFRRRKPILND